MIINDLDDYYIVFDTKNRNTELDALVTNVKNLPITISIYGDWAVENLLLQFRNLIE